MNVFMLFDINSIMYKRDTITQYSQLKGSFPKQQCGLGV